MRSRSSSLRRSISAWSAWENRLRTSLTLRPHCVVGLILQGGTPRTQGIRYQIPRDRSPARAPPPSPKSAAGRPDGGQDSSEDDPCLGPAAYQSVQGAGEQVLYPRARPTVTRQAAPARHPGRFRPPLPPREPGEGRLPRGGEELDPVFRRVAGERGTPCCGD